MSVVLQRFTGTWVDVSNNIRNLSITREGFRPELGEIRPGSAEVTLFDPTGTLDTSALDLGDKVRLMKDSHVLITGLVDLVNYTPRPTSIHYEVSVSIIESDALAQTTLQSGHSFNVERLTTGFSYFYLPLDDAPDHPFPRNQAAPGSVVAMWAGAPIQDVDIASSCAGGKEINLTSSILTLPPMSNDGSGRWHFSFHAAFPVLEDVSAYLFLDNESTTTLGALRLQHTAATVSGSLTTYLLIAQQGPGGLSIRSALVPNDGAVHHYAIEGIPGSTLRVWIDGDEKAVGPNSSNTTSTAALSTTVRHYVGGNTSVVSLGSIKIGHILQVGTADIPGSGLVPLGFFLYYSAALGAITPSVLWDTISQRVSWLVEQVGLTAGTIEEFPTLIHGVRGDDSASAHLHILSQSSGAMAFLDRDGLVQFHRPSDMIDHDIGEDYELPLTRVRDRARVVDSCVALTPSGNVIAAVGGGGRQVELTVFTLLATDAQERCQEVVDDSTSGRITVPTITTRPAKNDTWNDILPLDLGSLLSFTFDAVPYLGVVEGIRHNCQEHLSDWTASFSLSPLLENVLILDHSTQGQLDEERLG